MEELISILQSNLAFLRGIFNWTQKDLAEVLGTAPNRVSTLETGRSNMTPNEYIRLTKAISNMLNVELAVDKDAFERRAINYALEKKFDPKDYFDLLGI